MTACHPVAEARSSEWVGSEGHGGDQIPIVALVGRPNTGKSTFLARASRRFVETANAPGTTVVLERRRIVADGRPAWLVDLPGTRSLIDQPAGDELFWEILLGVRPDAILVVSDGGNLRRHLPLVLACRELGLPVVVAANLSDEAAAHGVEVDVGRLSQLLVAPVHRTSGRSGDGVDAAVTEVVKLAWRRLDVRAGRTIPKATAPAAIYPYPVERAIDNEVDQMRVVRSLGAAALDDGLPGLVAEGAISARGAAAIRLANVLEPHRWRKADEWVEQVERRRDVHPPFADELARLATSPWPGLPMFIGVTLGVFATMVVVGGWLAAELTAFWAATISPLVTAVVTAVVPWPALANAILWAVDGGLLGMVAVGIPYVLTFYVLLAALEDSGYLTSAATLMDRVFNVLGLPGRAAVPLLSAAGCNVPAIYGTRILRTRRERLLAAWLVTLTPCSAGSAVVIAALAPFAGPLVALAAFVVIAAVTVGAGLAANAMVPGRQPALVLELAPLRRPMLRHVVTKAWWRFKAFVVMATPVMLIGSFILGLVYESGLWAPLATFLEPASMGLLGLPAIVLIAILFAFLRKELALQLLIALAVVQYGASAANLGSFLSPAQLFVFAIVASISVPCAATFATLASEFGRRSALSISGASLVLALGTGAVLAHAFGIA